MGFPSNYEVNLHQDCTSVVWVILLNVSIVLAACQHDKVAAIAHMVFGWIIFLYSCIFVLSILVPYGFNQSPASGWIFYSHAVVGVLLFGLIVLQVLLGVLTYVLKRTAQMPLTPIKIIRHCHQFLGYIMHVMYNVQVLVAWHPDSKKFFYGFLAWDLFWFVLWIFVKFFVPKMERRIIDKQTVNTVSPSIGNIAEVRKQTQDFIIFANYVYDARGFEKEHPGGYRVIEHSKGR